MRKIKEVLRLRFEQKLSYETIGRSVNIGETTAREYIRRAVEAKITWPLADHIEEEQLMKLLFPPKKRSELAPVIPDFECIHKELSKKGVTLFLLWKDYQAIHPEGISYSYLTILYKQWCASHDTWMLQQHKAGESIFVDYAGLTIPIYNASDSTYFESQIFVACLGLSNYTYCRAYRDQKLDSWIDAHKCMFTFFDGVAEALIPDNLKAGVKTVNRYDPEINKTYYEMAAHYNTSILPARSYRPQDKAKVENAVQNTERQVLAPLRNQKFFSLTELNEAIAKNLAVMNTRPFQKMPGSSRYSLYLELDKPALKVLPLTEYELYYWQTKALDGSYHIEIEGSRYSVPYRLVGKQLEIRFNERLVEVFYKSKQVALHIRSTQQGALITNHEHRSPRHKHHVESTCEKAHEDAQKIGPQTLKWVEHVLADPSLHKHQKTRISLGVTRLAKTYPSSRIEAACERGLYYKNFSSRGITDMLVRNLDQQPLPKEEEVSVLPQKHINIRDYQYYA